MSEKYTPVKGDRVRVVLEGEIKGVYSDGDLRIESVEHYSSDLAHEGIVSIEKIEPPVEVFKPGDVVRSKEHPSLRYVIGCDGYFSFQGNDFRDHAESFLEDAFTSERYERVTLP